MNNQLKFIEEPKLKFAFNQVAEDSRDGLTLFGPYEKQVGSIRAGVIGPEDLIDCYKVFVTEINKPIYTSTFGRPFFPGFKTVFGLEWPNEPAAQIKISHKELNEKLGVGNLRERTYQLVSLYLEAIKKFITEEDTVIDIWYVLIPNTVLTLCRPKSHSSKPTFSKERVEQFNMGQMSLFQDEEEKLEEYSQMYEYDSDFHDQLKARAINEHIQVPIQVMLETTLRFMPKNMGEEYDDNMKAHLAWTHSSSLYYKLGKLPWKLNAVREGVCYVGLVFKKLQETSSKKGYACSAAQMFLDSGDGVVFRGNIGPWLSKDEKTFHLNKESAKKLLSVAVEAYKEKHKEYPRELFIHGRTSFTDDEWQGFEEAVKVSPTTNLVGVTIKENVGLRLMKKSDDKKAQFGILRGMCYLVNETCGYLWSKGFIPKTETTNHSEIARPLYVEIDRGTAQIETVMRDILALTKLNYNACIYGDGVPVTLRFSDKIGDILTAIPEVNWAVKPFKFYI